MQQVKVETLEKGFLINVVCEKNSPGLLLSVLEAFEEELGLQVVDARVSCSHNFCLQAITQVIYTVLKQTHTHCNIYIMYFYSKY